MANIGLIVFLGVATVGLGLGACDIRGDTRIVIDKNARTVDVEERYWLKGDRRDCLPLKAVSAVLIDYHADPYAKELLVFLITEVQELERIMIQKGREQEMISLGTARSALLQVNLVRGQQKAEALY